MCSDAVRMNVPTASATKKIIEDKLKNWIRQARDRDGGRYELALARRSNSDRNSMNDYNDVEPDNCSCDASADCVDED